MSYIIKDLMMFQSRQAFGLPQEVSGRLIFPKLLIQKGRNFHMEGHLHSTAPYATTMH